MGSCRARRNRLLNWSVIGLCLASLAACAEGGGATTDPASGSATVATPPDVLPLAKVDRWRDGLSDSFPAGPPFGLVEIATDRSTAVRAWDENVPAELPDRDGDPVEPGRYGTLGEVDFSTHAVVVWSSGQSGSCPGWLADVRTDGDAVELTTGQVPATVCTDDYRFYRMVLAVAHDRLPDTATLPTRDVTVDGRSAGLYSLVTAYPAGQ